MSVVYRFISPIKANRDAVKAKLAAKGATTVNKTAKAYDVKDKSGRLLERLETAPELKPTGKDKDGKDIYDKTCEEIEIYIVESDVKP